MLDVKRTAAESGRRKTFFPARRKFAFRTASVLGAAGCDTGRHDLAGDALVLAAVGREALFLLLNKRLRAPVAPLA
jgi:hypothetical protein